MKVIVNEGESLLKAGGGAAAAGSLVDIPDDVATRLIVKHIVRAATPAEVAAAEAPSVPVDEAAAAAPEDDDKGDVAPKKAHGRRQRG